MATICYCSLAADVFTAGVARNNSVDDFTEALASFLLMFRALLPMVFACCRLPTAKSTPRSKHSRPEGFAAGAVD